MRYHRVLIVVAAVLIVPALVLALGSDHDTRPAGGNRHWPVGLTAIANAGNRVHGYWVNDSDVFFYEGNTAALNTFLVACTKLDNTKVTLVIHAGKLDVQSPWDKQPRALNANWKLLTSGQTLEQMKARVQGPFNARVDVYLGESIKLNVIQVPENVEVQSGGEIEAFVKKHQKAAQ